MVSNVDKTIGLEVKTESAQTSVSTITVGRDLNNEIFNTKGATSLEEVEFDDLEGAAEFLDMNLYFNGEVLAVFSEVILSSDHIEQSIILAKEVGGIVKLTQSGVDFLLRKDLKKTTT